MKKILFILLLAVTTVFRSGTEKQDLPEKWKKWLDDEVAYIMTAKEKEIFLILRTEREREIFERALWLQRDPTPGTPANEFKDEHYRRLKYTDEYFGRGTFKRGRDTDRGRVYIILGEPLSVERFEEGVQNLNPCELWQYHGDTALGLPPFFYVLFYKQDLGAEFKLYSPSFDGPIRLIQKSFQGDLDRLHAYEQIKDTSAELAEASLTLIPGTEADPNSPTASMTSDLLLASIRNLPEKKIKSEWAVAFARNSEIISTDYSIKYLPSNFALFIHQAGRTNYLNAIIEPRRLTMSQDKDKAYAPLKLNIKVSGLNGSVIHQEEKDVLVQVSLTDFKSIERRMVAIGDIMPLVEGIFALNYLVRNTESKEFSSLEETVTSPGIDSPLLSPPLFLFGAKPTEGEKNSVPFMFDKAKLNPNTEKIFAIGEDLIVYFEIYNPNDRTSSGTLHIRIDGESGNLADLKEAVDNKRYFLKRFATGKFKPGFYLLNVAISDAVGREFLVAKDRFSISTASAIARPWRYDRIYPEEGHLYYTLIRAYQYLGLGQNERATREVEPYYNKENPSLQVALILAKAYFNLAKDADVVRVLTLVENANNADVALLLGKSYYRLGRYAEAIEALTKALNSIGQSVEILNLIGTSCMQLNDRVRALQFLTRSLELNPKQPEIQRAVDSLKKKGA